MQGVFNPNILIYHPPNSAEGLHLSAFHSRLVLGSDSETYYVILSKYNQNCLFSHVFNVEQFCISTVYIIRMSFSI